MKKAIIVGVLFYTDFNYKIKVQKIELKTVKCKEYRFFFFCFKFYVIIFEKFWY